MPAWVVAVLISIAFNVAAYLLTPKSKDNNEPDDIEQPTAEAGRPIPKVFGTHTIRSPNVLWYGDSGKRTYKVKA